MTILCGLVLDARVSEEMDLLSGWAKAKRTFYLFLSVETGI